MFSELPLKNFVEELSSPTPTPGGGAVSSVVASFGFSLIAMVLGISNKRNLDPKIDNLIQKAKEVSIYLLDLSSKDAEAFDKVVEAMKLPKETDEEREVRKSRIQEALVSAALVPLEVINTIDKHSFLLDEAFTLCPKSALSDIYTAVWMLEGGFEGAKSNVVINLKSIKDEKFLEETFSKLTSIESDFKNKLFRIKEELQNLLKI